MRIRNERKDACIFDLINITILLYKKSGMYRSMLINIIYLRDVRILFFYETHYRTTGHEPYRIMKIAFNNRGFFNYYRWDRDTLSRLMDFEGIFYSGYCNLSRTQPRWSRSEDFHLAKRMACDKNISRYRLFLIPSSNILTRKKKKVITKLAIKINLMEN